MKKRTAKTGQQASQGSSRARDSALRQVPPDPDPDPTPIPPSTTSIHPVEVAGADVAGADLSSPEEPKPTRAAPRMGRPSSTLVQRPAAARPTRSSSLEGASARQSSSSARATISAATQSVPPQTPRRTPTHQASPISTGASTPAMPPVSKATPAARSPNTQSRLTRPTLSSAARMSQPVSTRQASSSSTPTPVHSSSTASPSKNTAPLSPGTTSRRSVVTPSVLSLPSPLPRESMPRTKPAQPAAQVSTRAPSEQSDRASKAASSALTPLDDLRVVLQALRAAVARGDTDLLTPLRAALAGLVKLGDHLQRDVERAFTVFRTRVEAFEDLAQTLKPNDEASIQDLPKRIRTIAEIVLQLGEAVVSAVTPERDQEHDTGNFANLLEPLNSLLGALKVDESIANERQLAIVQQRVSSRDTGTSDEHPAVFVSHNITNTNYIVGSSGDTNNNTFNQTFVFSGAHSGINTTANEIMKEIRLLVGERFVPGAAYDAQPKSTGCMPGTRVGALNRFLDWVKNNPKGILWLAGMAGTGKTSIAVTLCQMLQADPDVVLGGSFFCSRSAASVERTDAQRVLPTIAVSLARHFPAFAERLAENLQGDGAHKPPNDQIRLLLQLPLVALASEARPIVFIIDALDECGNERELSELLKAIVEFTFPPRIKFILTSRPETHILGSPISDKTQNEVIQLHLIDSQEVTEDIRLFIDRMFAQHPLPDSEPWYSDVDVRALSTLSNGLFIFASTAITYILDTEDVEHRTTRLKTVLLAMKDSEVATGPLDNMYEFVLTRATNKTKVEAHELAKTQQILACILTARMPLSVNALSVLLERKPAVLRASLRRLRAVIHIPDDSDDPGLRTLHASFGDYLLERAASTIRITRSLGNEALARGSLHTMAELLHFNVSQSRSSYKSNTRTEPCCIALSLEYACLQWIYHISDVPEPSKLAELIKNVFPSKFLFWLEVMSVLNQVRRATAMLMRAIVTIEFSGLSNFFRDAHSFVASSREAIERAAPHIYISALPFAAKDSLVYRTFLPLCNGLISVDTYGIDRHGGRLVMTLTGHTATVRSVAYSPDGSRIGSGSRDGTVRIWNAMTGEETRSPLRSGDCQVMSVAFAPNGKFITSGNSLGIVCIWNLDTGDAVPQQLNGHSGRVSCVAYSPDGALIASASEDKTVRLWCALTGQSRTVLSGHTWAVNTVTFSPNGQIVASCSHDQTIQMWYVATGEPADSPYLYHSHPVNTICFSPDGTRLASGFLDRNIRVWEVETGRNIATLRGHTGAVQSIQFGPDGRSLVSSSYDQRVLLWALGHDDDDASFAVLDGHTDFVSSVAFSPNGLNVISASADGTIRVWNVGGSQEKFRPLPGHTGAVSSVSVSADGMILVSGSYDYSVRIWDARTCEAKLSPLHGQTGSVNSVAISADGALIASASADHTVRLWSTGTGNDIGNPLCGHEGIASAVALSFDGRWLASGSNHKTVNIWNISTGQPLKVNALPCNDAVYDVKFSPDARLLAAIVGDSYISIWHTESFQPLYEPLQADDLIRSLDFSPDSTCIALGSESGTVRLWDIRTGEQISALVPPETSLLSIAYAPDSQFIVAGSFHGTITIWHVATATIVATLSGHTSYVSSIKFTSDGRSIISGSGDHTIRVWDFEAALFQPAEPSLSPVEALGSTSLTDGWLLGPSGELLLWVPAEYRTYVQVSLCTALMAQRRVVIKDNPSGLYAGEDWNKCWSNLRMAGGV